jgi:glycosyltransferase involved in cell wall biosynthesis
MATLAQNPELCQQMGLAGWARARELFNTEDCAAKVFEIIQSVVNKA